MIRYAGVPLRPAIVLLMLALLLAVPRSASAQETGYLRVDDILPGECGPVPVVTGQHVDCRFPLAREVMLDPLGGPYVTDVEGRYDEENDEQADCLIEDGELVCRTVATYYPSGTLDVRVRVGWEGSTGVVAQIQTVDWGAVPVVFTPVSATEPYTMALRPLQLWVDGWQGSELYGRVRDRYTGEPVATLPIPEPGESFGAVSVDVTPLPPGRYRMQPCIPTGDGPGVCEEANGAVYFQVGSGEVVEAIAGWNRAGADRINLVLAGSGFADFESFSEVAVALLGFDGPTLLDINGDVAGPDDVSTVEWGPFATEPIRSRRDRFNIWLLKDLLADPHSVFRVEPPNGLGFGPGAATLPDVQLTAIELLPPGRWRTSEAGFPSFTSIEPGAPDRAGLQFAGAYVALPLWMPLSETETFTHELGHAVFDLRDEYTQYGRDTKHGYPNCAPDMEIAEAWWGDLVGEVDPFLGEYASVMESYGQWVPGRAELEASFAVGYEWGGCYGEQGGAGAVRPTADSIMHGQTPVFGSVNRRRAEEIMDLWTGRDVLRAATDLDVVCERPADDPWSVACRGSLVPYVDPPGDGLVMSVGGDEDDCTATGSAGGEPVVVVCGPIAAGGYDPVAVHISGGPGSLATVTLPAIEVTAIRVPMGFGGTPPQPVPDPSSPWAIWPALGVGGLAVLAVVVVGWHRGKAAAG